MTEYKHTPLIRRHTARLLMHDKMVLRIEGCEFPMPKRDAVALAMEILEAVDGPGPQIVCEVVEQVRL